MKIALLGATGYIGRSLLFEAQTRGLTVIPYTRDIKKAEDIFRKYSIHLDNTLHIYSDLNKEKYDVIINAAGIGSQAQLAKKSQYISSVTESLDSMLLNYLEANPHTRVFTMSSGVVHSLDKQKESNDDASSIEDTYALAKEASEARHRTYKEYTIVDLRIFTFFSRFVDVNDTFLLSQIVASLENNEEFLTNPKDIMRDIITTEDLLDTILFLINSAPANAAYDIVSKGAVKKFELLNYLKDTWNLSYAIAGDEQESPTGQKDSYCPSSNTLKEMGYNPKFTSLEGVHKEITERLRTA
ncbi:hypothetical protein CL644_01795 [bacterium]|nr:hypothetical protein [bacterium]|tara:strand:+ start:17063 stop:17959 length:897 start_codon:yes stop_codon:yes gene_type:complete